MAQDAGTLLVAAEAARKKGSAASFRSASERTGGPGNKLLYYTAEYTKSVLTVSRVVLTTLVVADGVLYTLTAEEARNAFTSSASPTYSSTFQGGGGGGLNSAASYKMLVSSRRCTRASTTRAHVILSLT